MAPSFGEALRFWLRLGFISFGGPAGQIAIMHREVVELRGWLDEATFLRALNFCTLLPGPEALQLAIYLGWRLHGTRGGLAAGLCFIGPAIVLLMALSFVYVLAGAQPAVQAALAGLKAVVVALIVQAAWRLGRRALGSTVARLVALAAFGAFLAGASFPLVLAAGALAGALAARAAGSAPPPATAAFPWRALLTGLALWAVPALLLAATLGPESLPARIYAFFTQAALVTFGGAYAVLAYVNQALVEGLGWITAEQAVAGLALAETTPGPLVIVLQFMGFMAGWNAPGELPPGLAATVSALAAAWATFLPSFVLIFVGAPYVERLTANARLAGALAAVTAVAVAAIASLALDFGHAVLWPDPAAQPRWTLVALAAVALALLTRTRVGSHWVIAGGALAGLALGAP